MKVLIITTGSVAAIRTPELVRALLAHDCEVRVVATEPSLFFWDHASVSVPVHRDRDEWPTGWKLGDPILHIELRRWADVAVIAPLDANTLGKIAHGFADNLATSVLRAWDRTKPMVVAPAMNTAMWTHPATGEALATLERWFPAFTIVPPVEKRLACGDDGIGALADVHTIAGAVLLKGQIPKAKLTIHPRRES